MKSVLIIMSVLGAHCQIVPAFLDAGENAPDIDTKIPFFRCDFSANTCDFDGTSGDVPVLAIINGKKTDMSKKGSMTPDKPLSKVVLQSRILKGPKCLTFHLASNNHDINWAISIRNPHKEIFIGFQGNSKVHKKLSVGLGTTKPYIISLHIFALTDNHERPTDGLALAGLPILEDSPCVQDRPSLNCTFDFGFCNWKNDDAKHQWFEVPFGLKDNEPHKIEYGALSPYSGNDILWSPLVTSDNARCFSFIYAKGEGLECYLRVYVLYKVGGKNVRTVLYEDTSKHKVLKRHVQIAFFLPFDFQVAFEGRSKTIMHGSVVLNTAFHDQLCHGIGDYMDVLPDNPADFLTTRDDSSASSTTERVTTPTTKFGPI